MSGSMKIRVLYSCHACGLEKVAVEVDERGADEDVVHWVEQTLGWALATDHRQRSPGCRAEKVDDVMIPVTGADRIGGAAKH